MAGAGRVPAPRGPQVHPADCRAPAGRARGRGMLAALRQRGDHRPHRHPRHLRHAGLPGQGRAPAGRPGPGGPAVSKQSVPPAATPSPAAASHQATAASAPGQAAGLDQVAEVEDLHVTFRRSGRDIHALRGVSLQIRAGEILGLVGESGSGKSVLGLSLLGLIPPESRPVISGRVAVHGQDMLNGPADLRRRIRREHLGAVFQDPMTSLNPTMRIGRQVAEAAGSGDEAVRLLRAVGIPDAARRMASYPHELSGGLRQRVMIAMAVAGNPALVIADEPTTALDVMVQAQVLGLLRSLRDEIGCSVLMITHDLGVAAQVADRVAVMYAGRLAELGPAAAVLQSAAHPYSLALTRARLSVSAERGRALATLPGEVPDPADPPPGCPFEPRCALAISECVTSLPDLVLVDEGHFSACIRAPAELTAAEQPTPAGADLTTSAPPAERAAVAVRDLTKTLRVSNGRRRAQLTALGGVDLDVAEGESVAIVGESGSGKTTLLRIIAGLEHADSGHVALGPGARPQMVFQDAGASLTPWLSVGTLIAERLRGAGHSAAERRQRVAGALAHVGLPAEVASARAGQLSGGQRQRVALARATRWRWPPDNWPARAEATSAGSPTCASASTTRWRRLAALRPAPRSRSEIRVPTLSHGVRDAPASWKTIWGRAPGPSLTWPVSARSRLAMIRSSVVLPDPLSPTIATDSPSATCRSTPPSAVSSARRRPAET